VSAALVVPALQAVVRDELAAMRPVDLGVVTVAHTNEGGTGDSNLAVDLRLRGSALELQRVPVAVGRLGVSAVPRPGDLAVVAFVGGAVDGAVVIGFVYDDETRPADAGADEVVYVVPDDARDGARRLAVELPNGNTLTVEDSKASVTLGGTTLTVEADGAITLEAAGDLVLKAGGKVAIEASGDVSVAGSKVAIEAQAAASIKGASVKLAGPTDFSAA